MANEGATVFACPLCRAGLAPAGEGLACPVCGTAFPARESFLDFAPEIERQPGFAQRGLESPAVAAIYERWARPLLIRLASSIRYAEEESYLDGHFAAVEGPVLDLGCGTGYFSRFLAGKVGARRVVGLDLSFAMLKRARREAFSAGLSDLSFVRGSALRLPFPDASLGAVNCSAALHLFPDPIKALSEVGRTLKSGGTFTCGTLRQLDGGFWRRRQATIARLLGVRFFEDAVFPKALERHGMRLVDCRRRRMVILLAARKI